VSKFDTTANFTPDFLRALNTSSAPGSLRCHAYMDDRQPKLSNTTQIIKKNKKIQREIVYTF